MPLAVVRFFIHRLSRRRSSRVLQVRALRRRSSRVFFQVLALPCRSSSCSRSRATHSEPSPRLLFRQPSPPFSRFFFSRFLSFLFFRGRGECNPGPWSPALPIRPFMFIRFPPTSPAGKPNVMGCLVFVLGVRIRTCSARLRCPAHPTATKVSTYRAPPCIRSAHPTATKLVPVLLLSDLSEAAHRRGLQTDLEILATEDNRDTIEMQHISSRKWPLSAHLAPINPTRQTQIGRVKPFFNTHKWWLDFEVIFSRVLMM